MVARRRRARGCSAGDLRHVRQRRRQQLGEHVIRCGVQPGGEPDEQTTDHRQGAGAHHPGRYRRACRPVGRGDPLPMRRKCRIRRLPLSRDNGVEVLAQPLELGRAARRQTIAALEPEAQAKIHQLQRRQECAGVLAKLAEQVEEPLAAAHFLMEGGYQRAGRPGAAAAPWRVQHHVVQAGAQRVVSRPDLIHRHTAVARRLLEGANLLDGALAQLRRIRLAVGVAQAPEQLQQRCGCLDQRVGCRSWIFSAASAVMGAAGAVRRRRQAVSPNADCGGAAGAALRPPGTGRITVRSKSSGSENGLSLMVGPLIPPRG